MNKGRSRCFFDIAINGVSVGRIIFELFNELCPLTCENFRALCTGEKGLGKVTSKPLHYKGTKIHRVVKDFIIQGGDFSAENGTGGESIYGGTFKDENLDCKHDRPFLLSMANRGKDTNGSQFFLTTKPAPHLDGKHVVFGHVIDGEEVVTEIENQKTDAKNRPSVDIRITNCGELVLKMKVKEPKKRKRKASTPSSSSDSDSESSSLSDSSELTPSSQVESESTDSEEERRRERKQRKKERRKIRKQRMKEKRKRRKLRKKLQTAEVKPFQSELSSHVTINPEEIPEVPAPRFLSRMPIEDKKADETAQAGTSREETEEGELPTQKQEPTVTRSGRTIKGRGTRRYKTPSRSRSREKTPQHWRTEAERRVGWDIDATRRYIATGKLEEDKWEKGVALKRDKKDKYKRSKKEDYYYDEDRKYNRDHYDDYYDDDYDSYYSKKDRKKSKRDDKYDDYYDDDYYDKRDDYYDKRDYYDRRDDDYYDKKDDYYRKRDGYDDEDDKYESGDRYHSTSKKKRRKDKDKSSHHKKKSKRSSKKRRQESSSKDSDSSDEVEKDRKGEKNNTSEDDLRKHQEALQRAVQRMTQSKFGDSPPPTHWKPSMDQSKKKGAASKQQRKSQDGEQQKVDDLGSWQAQRTASESPPKLTVEKIPFLDDSPPPRRGPINPQNSFPEPQKLPEAKEEDITIRKTPPRKQKTADLENQNGRSKGKEVCPYSTSSSQSSSEDEKPRRETYRKRKKSEKKRVAVAEKIKWQPPIEDDGDFLPAPGKEEERASVVAESDGALKKDGGMAEGDKAEKPGEAEVDTQSELKSKETNSNVTSLIESSNKILEKPDNEESPKVAKQNLQSEDKGASITDIFNTEKEEAQAETKNPVVGMTKKTTLLVTIKQDVAEESEDTDEEVEKTGAEESGKTMAGVTKEEKPESVKKEGEIADIGEEKEEKVEDPAVETKVLEASQKEDDIARWKPFGRWESPPPESGTIKENLARGVGQEEVPAEKAEAKIEEAKNEEKAVVGEDKDKEEDVIEILDVSKKLTSPDKMKKTDAVVGTSLIPRQILTAQKKDATSTTSNGTVKPPRGAVGTVVTNPSSSVVTAGANSTTVIQKTQPAVAKPATLGNLIISKKKQQLRGRNDRSASSSSGSSRSRSRRRSRSHSRSRSRSSDRNHRSRRSRRSRSRSESLSWSRSYSRSPTRDHYYSSRSSRHYRHSDSQRSASRTPPRHYRRGRSRSRDRSRSWSRHRRYSRSPRGRYRRSHTRSRSRSYHQSRSRYSCSSSSRSRSSSSYSRSRTRSRSYSRR